MKVVVQILFFLISIQVLGQVGINNATPDSSAILDMESDTAGFLMPRMGSFERQSITDPANSLILYDTTDAMFFYHDSINDNGTSDWIGVSAWKHPDNDQIYTQESVKHVVIGTQTPIDGNSFTVANNVVIGDNSSSAPDNGLFVARAVDTGSLDVTDPLRATTLEGKGTIPVGGIIFWAGEPGDVPENWALCDGTTVNGIATPDLQGRFVVGFNASASTTPTDATNKEINTGRIGNTGGQDVVTITSDEMPSHNHGGVTGDDGDHNHSYTNKVRRNRKDVDPWDEGNYGSTNITSTTDNTHSAGDHSHVIDEDGGGLAHENRPPYYVVAYIIRVK